MTKRTICFDLDGVLLRSRSKDSKFLWTRSVERELSLPSDLFPQIFSQPIWKDIITGKREFRPHLDHVFGRIGALAKVDAFIDYWLLNDLNWYDEALKVVDDLKKQNFQTVILSNQDLIRTSFIRSQEALSNRFDAIITSAEIGCQKPDLDFFRKAAARLETNCENLVLIDDDRRNIHAAKELGWRVIHFDPDLDPLHSFDYLRQELKTKAPKL